MHACVKANVTIYIYIYIYKRRKKEKKKTETRMYEDVLRVRTFDLLA